MYQELKDKIRRLVDRQLSIKDELAELAYDIDDIVCTIPVHIDIDVPEMPERVLTDYEVKLLECIGVINGYMDDIEGYIEARMKTKWYQLKDENDALRCKLLGCVPNPTYLAQSQIVSHPMEFSLGGTIVCGDEVSVHSGDIRAWIKGGNVHEAFYWRSSR